eukprot:TRINITY_DN4331_c0_g1_i4.p1 TRINITY_DN4331_c0_g1~~TRINITY_DN4331_c0_g1_i4.p1  ORF type:complete len:148 (-),score=78.16 TRINITY_DN4331_c0_g1_i4:67-480(-)
MGAQGKIRATATDILVASIGSKMLESRMEICAELWAAGIKAEFLYKENPKIQPQIQYALESGIPFMLIIGGDEIAQGIVKVKNLRAQTEVVIQRAEMVSRLIADINEEKQVLSQLALNPVVVENVEVKSNEEESKSN